MSLIERLRRSPPPAARPLPPMADGRWWVERADRPGELGTVGLTAAGRLHTVAAHDDGSRALLDAACAGAQAGPAAHDPHCPVWPPFRPKPWHCGPPQRGQAMNVRSALLDRFRRTFGLRTTPAHDEWFVPRFLNRTAQEAQRPPAQVPPSRPGRADGRG